MLVSVDCFVSCTVFHFAIESGSKPFIRGAARNNAHFFAELARIEIHHKLPREGLKPGAIAFNDDVPSIGVHTQFGKRSVRMQDSVAQRRERAPQTVRWNSVFRQLLYSA